MTHPRFPASRALYYGTLETPFITRPFLHKDGEIRQDTLIYYRMEPWVIPEITGFSLTDDTRTKK